MADARKPGADLSGWRRFVFGRDPRRTLIRVTLVVVGSILVFRFVLLPIRVTGISMHPTYRDGSINAINRLAYHFADPQRYDVVLVHPDAASNPNSYLKRIVALPGETFAFERGVILINGQPLPEPYLRQKLNWTADPILLASNEYFVVGDNRSMHPTNHALGVVTRAEIIGRILFPQDGR
jgi:signal peptidase I